MHSSVQDTWYDKCCSFDVQGANEYVRIQYSILEYLRILQNIVRYLIIFIFSYVRILLLVSLGCILASKTLGMTNVARSTFKVLMNGPNDKQSCWPTLMIGPID